MDDKGITELKSKYKKVLVGNEKPFVISYKGNLWEGVIGKDGVIYAKSITGLLSSELKLAPGMFRVIISEHAYGLLIQNTHSGYYETGGALLGTRHLNSVIIYSVLNFSKKLVGLDKGPQSVMSKFLLVAGGGTGGSWATETMDKAIARLGGKAVGFYHSHPTFDFFSPGDKGEFKKLKKFPHLKEPSKIHVLCRRSAAHRVFSRYTLLPRAYFEAGLGYKEVPVIIRP